MRVCRLVHADGCMLESSFWYNHIAACMHVDLLVHVLSILACSCLHSCWFVSVGIYVFVGVCLHICGCVHVGVCTYLYVWSMGVSVCLYVCERVAIHVPMCRSKNFFMHVYI